MHDSWLFFTNQSTNNVPGITGFSLNVNRSPCSKISDACCAAFGSARICAYNRTAAEMGEFSIRPHCRWFFSHTCFDGIRERFLDEGINIVDGNADSAITYFCGGPLPVRRVMGNNLYANNLLFSSDDALAEI